MGEDALTRSEEELGVTKVSRPRTRVRLRKYIVTEMVTTTVPVRREELRVEREPIAEGDAGSLDGAEPSDEVHEMILHEERLVIETQVVATERVRIRKETVTEERLLSEEVRREQVVIEES